MAITANKLLGKNGKGGPLAVSPKANLVPFKDKGSDITKVEATQESPLLVIRKKVVKIEDILQGTLAAEKKAADDRRKEQEDEDRDKQEEELETPKTKGKGIKLPVPGKIRSWWANIKKFFGTVLLGWLVLNLMKWLPKLKGILSLAVKFFEFFVWLGGHLLNAVITAVHWGYKAFEWTRDVVGNVFGEGGLKAFDRFTSILKWVLNFQFTLTLAMIAFSNEFGENLLDISWRFIRQILKHGLGRAPRRLLLKLLGKKGTQTLLTQGGRMLTQATAIGSKALSLAKMGVKAVFSVPGLIVAGAGLLASAIGEGGAWALKNQEKMNQRSQEMYNRQKDKKWYDPRKWGSWVQWKWGELNQRVFGYLFGLFDVIGAPFRLIIEAVRWPFMSEKQKDIAALNLEKFDARVREQFRMFANMFDVFGLISDEKGSWGAMDWHSGKSGTDAMGYTKDGKTLSNTTDSISEYDESVDGSKSEKIIYVKKNSKQIGRSVAKNREKPKIIAVSTGSGGGGGNPYANSYRGN